MPNISSNALGGRELFKISLELGVGVG